MFVTRGMVEELPLVKEMVKSLVKAGSKVNRWVLVSIKDPEVEIVSVSNDHEDIEESLDELEYGGGGDLQEQVLKGGRNSFKTSFKKVLFYSSHSWITKKSLIQ